MISRLAEGARDQAFQPSSPESTVSDVKSHQRCKLHGKGFIFHYAAIATWLNSQITCQESIGSPEYYVCRAAAYRSSLPPPPRLHLLEFITRDRLFPSSLFHLRSRNIPEVQFFFLGLILFITALRAEPWQEPRLPPVLNVMLRSGPTTSAAVLPQGCGVALYQRAAAAAWSCLRWMVISCWVSALRATPHPYSGSVGTR